MTLPVFGAEQPRRRALALQRPADEQIARGYRVGSTRSEAVGEQSTDDDGGSRSTADVYVFGSIGGWSGVSAKDFVRDVAGLDVDHINLHLNSPGGDAYDGVAIHNVLRQHRADVTVWVDGLAASAASVIAMAGDEVVMGVGAQLMVHDAWALSIGDADEMRKAAAMLDSASNAIAGVYAAKAGGTAAEWRAVMQGEAWYAGEEAVTAGLADRIATDDDKGTASGEQVVPGRSDAGLWDMWDSLADANRHADAVAALFAHAGRADAPPPPMPGHPGTRSPAASAGGFTPPQEDDTMSTLTEGLRQRLGFAEDADDSLILAALDKLKASADAPKLPDGAVAIEKDTLQQLQAAAKDGQDAREQQRTEHRERLVSAAVADGRIAPARRDHWLNALKADPEGAEQSLASLAPGLIPVTEAGHAGNDADVDEFGDAALNSLEAAAGLPKGALRG